MAQANVLVRLSIKDAEVVRQALIGVGADGERALKRIEAAGRVPSAGLKALGAASDELKGRLGDLGSSLGSTGMALAALGPGGLAAAAGLGALALGLSALMARTRAAIDSLDDLGDAAAKVGVSAESLQELRFAFEQLGAPLASVDGALAAFTATIGKVSLQGDEAAKKIRIAFEALGISLADVQRSDPVELLSRVATAISKLDDTARQAAIAKQLGIEDLLPALRAGGQAIDGLRDSARRLGIVLDEDLVRRAGEAKNQLSAMQQVLDAQLTRALVNATPLVLALARAFGDVAERVGLAIDRLKEVEARSSHTLQVEVADLDRQIRLQQQTIEAAKAPRGALTRGLADLGLARPQDLEVRQAEDFLADLQAERDRRQAILDARAQAQVVPERAPAPVITLQPAAGGAGGRSGSGGGDGAPVADAAARQLQREQDLLNKWREAWLKANGQVIDAIELRRAAELTSADRTIADEQRRLDALMLINETFDAEVIKAETERDARLMATAREFAEARERVDAQIGAARIAYWRESGENLRAIEAELARDLAAIDETAVATAEERDELASLRRQRAMAEAGALGEAQAAKLREASERTADSTVDLAGAFREFGQSAGSAFEDAIMKGEQLSDVLTGLATDLQRIMVRKTITEPLGGMMDDMIGAAGKGGGAGTGLVGWLGEQFGSRESRGTPFAGGIEDLGPAALAAEARAPGGGGLLAGLWGGAKDVWDDLFGPAASDLSDSALQGSEAADQLAGSAAGMFGAADDLGAGGAAGDLSASGDSMVGLIGQAMQALVAAVGSAAGSGGGAGGILGMVGGLLGTLFGGAGGGFAGGEGSDYGASAGGSAGDVLASAAGNVFDRGTVVPFARGGIVDRPTLFPLARGAGLMGEAGPEAVLPLRRLPGGNLGVGAAGIGAGGGGVVVNIINNAGARVTTEERRDQGGRTHIDVIVDAVEQQVAQRMTRPGTVLNRAYQQAANPIRSR